MFEIADFTEDDAEALAQISNEAFSDELARGMSSFTFEGFINSSKRSGVKTIVARSEGETVGFLRLTEGAEGQPAQIHLVAVETGHRGQGLGMELVRAAIDHVRKLRRAKMKLFTRPWNTAMIKVCINLGFIPEAYLRREYLDADLIQYSYFPE